MLNTRTHTHTHHDFKTGVKFRYKLYERTGPSLSARNVINMFLMIGFCGQTCLSRKYRQIRMIIFKHKSLCFLYARLKAFLRCSLRFLWCLRLLALPLFDCGLKLPLPSTSPPTFSWRHVLSPSALHNAPPRSLRFPRIWARKQLRRADVIGKITFDEQPSIAHFFLRTCKEMKLGYVGWWGGKWGVIRSN